MIKSLCFKVEPALPSWNEVYGSSHWTVRARLQRLWKKIVGDYLKAHLAHKRIRLGQNKLLFDEPVRIVVTNYAPRPIDSANIYTKCLDALEGLVIVNDGYKHAISTEGVTRFAKTSFASILVEPITTDRLSMVRQAVAQQAEDDGLWFSAQTAGEAYLQQELRKLHAVIEGETTNV